MTVYGTESNKSNSNRNNAILQSIGNFRPLTVSNYTHFPINRTLSFGADTAESACELNAALIEADKNMYRDKFSRRNLVAVNILTIPRFSLRE
jgi:GGDEF domain-containing protein